MRFLFVIFFSLPVMMATMTPAAGQVVSDQVLTGDELVSRGIYRLGDIGHLMTRGRMSSVDGFASNFSIGGLSPLQHSSYNVVVDGHHVETGFWDVQNLTSLGIPITDVDSIRVVEHPTISNGTLAAGGLIEIWTRSYEEPVTTSFSTFAGNESGDPGPYRYSQNLGYANVDKIGPDAAASITIKNDEALFSGGISVNQLIPSDEAVFLRNRRIFDVSTTPEVRMISPRVRIGWAGAKFQSDARAFATTDRDMVYSSAIAREIPVDLKELQASWIGNIQMNPDRGIRVSASYRLVDVSNLSSATRIPLNWNESTLRSNVTIHNSSKKAVVSEFGSSVVLAEANALQGERIESQRSISIFGTSRTAIGRANIVSTANIGRHNDFFVGGVLTSAVLTSGRNAVALQSSFMRLPRYESDRVGSWLAAGLNVSPTIPTVSAYGESYGLYSTDAKWSWVDQERGLRIEVVPSLRYFQDIDLNAREIRADGEGFVVVSNKSQRSDGTMAGLTMRAQKATDLIRASLAVDLQEPVQGDLYFKNTMGELPSTKVMAETVLSPAQSFNAVVAATYLSAASWADFQFLDADENSSYSSGVESAFRVDAGISKTFWSGRVRLQVMLENIFNDHISYHPIGARFDRTMKLTAHVKLD